MEQSTTVSKCLDTSDVAYLEQADTAMETGIVIEKQLVDYVSGSDAEDNTVTKTGKNAGTDNPEMLSVIKIEPVDSDNNSDGTIQMKTPEMLNRDSAEHPDVSQAINNRTSCTPSGKKPGDICDINSGSDITIDESTNREKVHRCNVGTGNDTAENGRENVAREASIVAVQKLEVNEIGTEEVKCEPDEIGTTEIKCEATLEVKPTAVDQTDVGHFGSGSVSEGDQTDSNCLERVAKQDGDMVAMPTTDVMSYRIDGGDTDTSEEGSSSDSEEEKKPELMSDRDDGDDAHKDGTKKTTDGSHCVRTRGEMYPEDLPPLEDLTISVDESVEIQLAGVVKSIVGVLVVIEGNKELLPLNEDTVLFKGDREAFGKVFEVFGPVVSPFYSVRFNSPEDIASRDVNVGLALYCAPQVEEYTHFVFVEKLKRIKGSDASWENNNEPPSWCLEFSDDEDEKKRKAKNRNKTPVDGNTDEQPTNKQPCNRQRKPRGENRTGPNSDNARRGGNRGRRGRQSSNQSSWPPSDSSTWPAQTNQEPWSSPDINGWPPSHPRHFSPSGQPSQSFISPGVFRGGRGNRHPGGPAPRFSPFPQMPHRGHSNYQGHGFQHQGDWFQGQGHFNDPGQGHFNDLGNTSTQSFNGHFQGNGFASGPHNSAPIMDTRYIQNAEEMSDPSRMNRPPLSMFGGGPQFSSGLPGEAGFGGRPEGSRTLARF